MESSLFLYISITIKGNYALKIGFKFLYQILTRLHFTGDAKLTEDILWNLFFGARRLSVYLLFSQPKLYKRMLGII